MVKINEKIRAIKLRKEGKTYSEILGIVSVAKSTLSLWLRSVGMSKTQHQRITRKRIEARQRGARRKRELRVERQLKIFDEAESEIVSISNRELWLIGIALYWAEGSKEKEYRPGQSLQFTNSDPVMIKLFIKWLRECLCVTDDSIKFQIYIHESHVGRKDEVGQFWSNTTDFPIDKFAKIYLKKNKLHSRRRNNGVLYNGVVRVTISSSSKLNRRVTGWVRGISKKCGIV